MPPKGKKSSPKHPSKRKLRKIASQGQGTYTPRTRQMSTVRDGRARPPQYSAQGDWEIMDDGSSRRRVKASDPKSKGEQKPYSGWSRPANKK